MAGGVFDLSLNPGSNVVYDLVLMELGDNKESFLTISVHVCQSSDQPVASKQFQLGKTCPPLEDDTHHDTSQILSDPGIEVTISTDLIIVRGGLLRAQIDKNTGQLLSYGSEEREPSGGLQPIMI